MAAYATCSIASATAAKVATAVSCSFTLETGAEVIVKFITVVIE